MSLVEIDGLTRGQELVFEDDRGRTNSFWLGLNAVVTVRSKTFVVSGSETQGFAVSSLRANGALDLVEVHGTWDDRFSGVTFDSAALTAHKIGHRGFVYMASNFNTADAPFERRSGVSVIEIGWDGNPRLLQQIIQDGVLTGGGRVSSFGVDPVVARVGQRDFLLVGGNGRSESGIVTYAIGPGGRLTRLEISDVGYAGEMAFARVGDKTFVLDFGRYDVAPLRSFELRGDGSLRAADIVKTDEIALFNRNTTDIVTAAVGGTTYAFVSEVTEGSVLVFRVDAAGDLALVEQETPGLGDRWRSIEALTTFRIGAETYLAGGGYGDGIAVFRVSAGGALTEVDEFIYNPSSLRNTYDLDAVMVGTTQYLVSSSFAGAELRSFRFIPDHVDIAGGGRNNRLTGTDADDMMDGRGGADTVRGGAGDDMIEGGLGNDCLSGGDGDDHVSGEGGNDRIDGGTGDDFLFGGAGNDRIAASGARSHQYGDDGDDSLTGGIGRDRLSGGQGADALSGGGGDDRLIDGSGSDVMTGGAGADVFVLLADGATDRITDFVRGDRIDLSAFDGLRFAELTFRDTARGVELRFAGDVLRIDGPLGATEFTLGDFVF